MELERKPQLLSFAVVAAVFGLDPKDTIHLQKDDKKTIVHPGENAYFVVGKCAEYFVYGSPKRDRPASPRAPPTEVDELDAAPLLQTATFRTLKFSHLRDDQKNIVRVYVNKHAEIAQRLTDGSYPDHIAAETGHCGKKWKSLRKDFKKRADRYELQIISGIETLVYKNYRGKARIYPSSVESMR